MSEFSDIRIPLVRGADKAYLGLEGTVLLYRDSVWARDTEVQIPVELVNIVEEMRLNGARLVYALAALALSLMAGVAILSIPLATERRWSGDAAMAFIVAGVLVAVLPFILLMSRFLTRERMVSFFISPRNGRISFWVRPDREPRIDRLIDEIRRRQKVVAEELAYPAKFAIGDVFQYPARTAVALTCVAALPAFFARAPVLLTLCLLPVGWYLYRRLSALSQPWQYRRAVVEYERRNWGRVIQLLDELVAPEMQHPLSALMCIRVSLFLNRFGEASRYLGAVQNHIAPETVQEIETEIIQRERIYRRRLEVPGIPSSPPGGPRPPGAGRYGAPPG